MLTDVITKVNNRGRSRRGRADISLRLPAGSAQRSLVAAMPGRRRKIRLFIIGIARAILDKNTRIVAKLHQGISGAAGSGLWMGRKYPEGNY